MQPTVMRFEVLKKIDTGEAFDLVFITADRKRGTGGDIKSVHGYKKIMDVTREVRPVGQFKKASAVISKNPNHNEHKTINIFNPEHPDDHAISVHWRLIVFFNQQRVIG